MSHFTYEDFRKILRGGQDGAPEPVCLHLRFPIPPIYLSLTLHFSQFENDAHTMNLENKKRCQISLYIQPHHEGNFTVASGFVFLHGFNF